MKAFLSWKQGNTYFPITETSYITNPLASLVFHIEKLLLVDKDVIHLQHQRRTVDPGKHHQTKFHSLGTGRRSPAPALF